MTFHIFNKSEYCYTKRNRGERRSQMINLNYVDTVLIPPNSIRPCQIVLDLLRIRLNPLQHFTKHNMVIFYQMICENPVVCVSLLTFRATIF